MEGRRKKARVGVLAANDFLWKENQGLRQQLDWALTELDQARLQNGRDAELIASQRQQIQSLTQDNTSLHQRVADLEQQAKAKAPPAFVKANLPRKKNKKPGRPAGHQAELRPVPPVIDVRVDVPLPIDSSGAVCCPDCMTRLNNVKHHQRLVEDIVPPKPLTTCYNTTSGFCPCCRKPVESRAPEQPPAANVPHAQLGLNTLATAAMLRVCNRLPLRQISGLFARLPGLRLSAAAVVGQLKRLGRWLIKEQERLKLALRVASVVHADETGWRINGRNGYLWTIGNADHTLYHVDRSRGGKVIRELLGEAFGRDGNQTLVSDFYGAYDKVGSSQQKCLAHLLRELKDLKQGRPEMAKHSFVRRCERLIREMLGLKKKRGEMEAGAYGHQVELLENRLKKLGLEKWEDADARRLGLRLAKNRGKLTTFLHREEVEATNNAAERALRPVVVMRKITGGSRSMESAQAWAVLASVIRSAEQRGEDVLGTIKGLLKAQWAGLDGAVVVNST